MPLLALSWGYLSGVRRRRAHYDERDDRSRHKRRRERRYGGTVGRFEVGAKLKRGHDVGDHRRFGSDGEEVGVTPIANLDDRFVFDASAIALSDDTALLVENRCPIPLGTDTGLGCSQPTPRLTSVAGGDQTVLDLQRPVLDEPAMLTPVAATEETLAVVAEPLNGEPGLAFIDLDTGEPTTGALPDGVGAHSVCGQGDEIYAASSVSDNGITARSVSLHRSSTDADAEWAALGEVALQADAVGADTAQLACGPSIAVWATMNQPDATLVTFDLNTGTGVEAPSVWSDTEVSSVALCAGKLGVVVSGASPDRQTAHYRLVAGAQDGLGDEAESAGELRAPPVGCPLDDHIVDASQAVASGSPAQVVR